MTIGDQLKRARKKKEITLNEVYQQTRIHPNVLSALEEDSFDKILNIAYSRSFLREYASYLGLDSKKILAEHDKSHYKGEERITTTYGRDETRFTLPKLDKDRLLNIARIAIVVALIFTAFLALAKTVGWIKSRIVQRRDARAKQAESIKPMAKLKLAAKKEPAEKKSVTTIDAKGLNIPVGEKLKLTITVTSDVWIELKSDGKIISSNVLKKGSSETWLADRSFEVWTGNASAMKLSLNGNRLGSPGRGVMRGVVVTREGIKK